MDVILARNLFANEFPKLFLDFYSKMIETHVGFLCNIASTIKHTETNDSLKFLKSYYLMRCNEITGGYGLPVKHFSSKARCPRCCMEWTSNPEVKIRPIKLSKKQRYRLRTKKKNKDSNINLDETKTLLPRNEMEQTCTFCKQTTNTQFEKPEKLFPKLKPTKGEKKTVKVIKTTNQKNIQVTKTQKKLDKNKSIPSVKQDIKKTTAMNVYSNAFDVFSLKNDENYLLNSIKEPLKVIKNNKKKKDKFAGLCHKAVLATAKMKQEKDKQNKLNLFLKPSSG